LPTTADAQGTRADYERARSVRKRWEGQVWRVRVVPHWFAQGDRFWYRNDLPDGEREFVRVDALKGTREPAFNHERLAEALARATGKKVLPRKLPLAVLTFSDTADAIWFAAFDRHWYCRLENYELREQHQDEKRPNPLIEQEPRPTRTTGPAVAATFVNRTGGRVEVFWCQPNGRLRSYGTIEPAAERRLNTFVGHVWVLTDPSGRILAAVEAPVGGERLVLDDSFQPKGRAPVERPPSPDSPDGAWTAVLADHNVRLRNRRTHKEVPLTRDGTADDGYRNDFFWSPDSKKLVALRTQRGAEHKVHLIESSPKDQLQPRLHTLNYLKPGDRVPVTKPHLFDVAAREIALDDTVFATPWDISEVRWEPDGRRFTFLYNQRGHQILRVITVDADSGKAAALVDERSKSFIDYANKRFLHPLNETRELIWMSERDGWNHLYLYDAQTGAVKNAITRGEWVVRRVDRVDEARRQVWFWAGGIRPGQDPYYLHYARVNLDGTGLVMLTEGDGTHEVQPSPDRRFFIDSYSRVDRPPVTELRRGSDGGLVCTLERADISALKQAGWKPPEPFVAKGRDGQTDIYGVIFRPSNFEPGGKYPIIEHIYAGPQGAYVPKAFAPFHSAQALAELGFVVVQIDGMGTSHRSKAFHDVCWRNLGDAGFPDRIRWLKAAAARDPALDLSRVGIYGGSAGGQNALRGLLAHGNFYKVGVADCGCHDNRMDKIWWNELWMGWPVGPEYAAQSNVTNAHKLQGKLLLIVGELDRNVDPASTMQVANALIKADKDFDLLVIPGAGHGAAENPYGQRRRQDFFVRHLLGVEPRSRP
jgi:dipeptidyl aminopeptidase/acylaminoacyl peptidase